LLVLRREHLVHEGVIPADAWTYFAESVQSTGDARKGTEALLQRVIRYEVFSEIDLSGLLHYMVTFNTGQRRMSLAVQLEIMRQPLIEALEKQAQIPVWHELQKLPSLPRPKDQFDAKDLVLAAEAFLTHNARVSAAEETERFLDEDHCYLEDIGEIQDVVTVLQYLATQMQPRLLQVYATDPTRRFLLSRGGTFLVSLAAACGYVRWRNNMKMLEGALDKLLVLLHRPVEDPLNLDAYQRTLTRITSARGKNIRRLVNATFLRFFSGVTSELEWEDTAGQILGTSVRREARSQRVKRTRASCPLRRIGGYAPRHALPQPTGGVDTHTGGARWLWARPPPHCLEPGYDHVEDCHHRGVRAGTDGSPPSLSTSRYGLPACGSWAHCLSPHPL
jgi:hypothetical protein